MIKLFSFKTISCTSPISASINFVKTGEGCSMHKTKKKFDPIFDRPRLPKSLISFGCFICPTLAILQKYRLSFFHLRFKVFFNLYRTNLSKYMLCNGTMMNRTRNITIRKIEIRCSQNHWLDFSAQGRNRQIFTSRRRLDA